MTINPVIASFQNEPALIAEGRGAWFQSCAAMASAFMVDMKLQQDLASDNFWYPEDDWRAQYRPYSVKAGILQIPVKGVLLNQFPYALGDWATGYEYINEAFKRGMADPDVKGIAFVIDSGGGMLAGNFDLVDRMFAERGKKPMASFAAEHAYSAAYSIASVGDSITVGRTGGVGSIGVVIVHAEVSKALDAHGVTINIIRSKPGKMEGNDLEPLSDAARGRMQERVDAFHKEFVALVARNRGLKEKDVDETNALTFMPQRAVEIGLADNIGNLDDAFTAFVASIHSKEDDPMAENTQAGTTNEEHQAALAAATAAATQAGAKAEQTRIAAILDSTEAATRPAAARMLAFETDKSAEEATKMLAKLPEETKAKGEESAPPAGAGAPKGMLAAAMNGTTNPDLSSGDTPEGNADTNKPKAEDVLARVKAMNISGFKKE